MSAELKPCPFYGQAYVLPDGRILVRSAAEIKAAGVLLPKGTIVCDLVPEDVNEATHEELARLRATPAPGAPGQEAAAVQAVSPLSDAQIISIRKATRARTTTPWSDTLAFARAILAALPPSGAGEKTL